MIQAKIGDILSCITPPRDNREGYCQSGKVILVTETEIVLAMQIDLIRHVHFNRRNGFDTADLGSFIVRPDFL